MKATTGPPAAMPYKKICNDVGREYGRWANEKVFVPGAVSVPLHLNRWSDVSVTTTVFSRF